MRKIKNSGFTIVELLIASMVFTTILLLCMDGITRIAKVYIKNSSISKTNEFTKSFIEDVAQQIKYGSTFYQPLGTSSDVRLCINGYAYSVRTNQKPGAVRRRADPTCSSYSQTDYFNNISLTETVSPEYIRIMKFSVGNTSPYSISMRVVLGDNDLLQDGSGKSMSDPNKDLATIQCKPSISGSEFCAVIELSTTATRRVK